MGWMKGEERAENRKEYYRSAVIDRAEEGERMEKTDVGQMPLAVILAGGKGKRLLPLTEHCPKPLLPVGGEPLLFQIVEDLYGAGVRHFVITAGYGAEQIKRAVYEYGLKRPQMTLEVIAEDRPLGSAGCLLGIKELSCDRFFVVCGDAYGKRDYGGMLANHLKKGAFASLFLTRVTSPVEYGLVTVCGQGRITSFLEKPTWSQATTDLANGGVYLLEREVLSFIPQGRSSDFGSDLFPTLLASGKPLYGYQDGGYWQDIGDRAAYLACNMQASGGKSVIGKGCDVKGEVRGSVLLDGVTVEADCVISESVIGRDCRIGRGTVIKEGCVLGDGCVIGEGCRLHGGAVLWGGTVLEAGRSLSGGSQAKTLHFEEHELLLTDGADDDFFMRLGYAFAVAAGDALLFMHDGSGEAEQICTALGRGARLRGVSPAMAATGFYSYCAGLTVAGGFSASLLVACPRGRERRILFFDRAGLPAGGRLIRRIRDGFSGEVICGRVGRERWIQKEGEARYKKLLCSLSGFEGAASFTVGVERGTPARELFASILKERGTALLPYGQGEVNLSLSPDGRRCRAEQRRSVFRKEEEGEAPTAFADFWHLCAIALLDRLKKGKRVSALPDRIPEALFVLAQKWGQYPVRYPLQGAVTVDKAVSEALASERETLDGCLTALTLLAVMEQRRVDLKRLLREIGELCPFEVYERELDCAPEEKLSLLLSVGAEPAGEGLRSVFDSGRVRICARGGRGLSLMAEAASESDAVKILEEMRRALLEKRRELHPPVG